MSGNPAREWQFDGLVGPTHNYAGLAFGNVASANNAGSVSNPKAAALQGIEKMRLVRRLGIPQAFLPPRKRPVISVLQQLGFGQGSSPEAIARTLENAYHTAPNLLASAFSSSFMWAANAATISPSADTADGKLHLTPANLTSHFHRALEADETTWMLRQIFHNEALFVVHNPLPRAVRFSDEGAANHMRICSSHGEPGIGIFVYGADDSNINKTEKFPARQQQAASAAIARQHGLAPGRFLMVQQHPAVIDRGVFHHDVIGMNTTRLMITHAHAFLDQDRVVSHMQQLAGGDFIHLQIGEDELPVADAVRSYFFNSQLLELPSGRFVILAPGECENTPRAHAAMQALVSGNKVVESVQYLNVRESMRNGGGPACLRLRVVMTEREAAAIHSGVIMSDAREADLIAWVERHYRDRLHLDDLRNPGFVKELEDAYADLAVRIGMPGLYRPGIA